MNNTDPQTPNPGDAFAGTNTPHSDQISNVLALPPTSAFTPLAPELYKEALEKLNGTDATNNTLDFVSDEAKAEIGSSLGKFGVAFVTGPIRIGKTVTVNYFAAKFCDTYAIETIDGEVLLNKKEQIGSSVEMYRGWIEQIADHICDKLGKSLKDCLDSDWRTRINDKKTFEAYLKSFGSRKGDLERFLRALDRLKVASGFKKDILIAFHIDDIHAHMRESVFENFKKDIERLPRNPTVDSSTSAKLLIGSRYLPLLNQESILLVPHFSKEIIEKIARSFGVDVSDEVRPDLVETIHTHTDGYPWFVIRFFKIYLSLRIDGKTEDPKNLTMQIMENKSYWLDDRVLGNNQQSEFLDELKSLIDTTTKSGSKTAFSRFIKKESSETSLVDVNYSLKEPLIIQSGFFKVDSRLNFENNGCLILKKHFIKEIEAEL